MYHDIFESEPVTGVPRSAAIYHTSSGSLAQHLSVIRASAIRVVTVGQLADGISDHSLALTFDDGWRGAFEIAIPLLQEFAFKATFFITRDFVGKKGFSDENLILQAARAGMEIGVHGTTHRMLSYCSREEIMSEFTACKNFLEALLGKPVRSASVPGGDWTTNVALCAQEAGLRCLCTSRAGINRRGISLFNLKRIAIRGSTTDSDVQRYCKYNINKEQLRWAALHFPKHLLGMRRYALFRTWLLGERRHYKHNLFEP